jgi:hypothetical protein
MSSLQGRLDEFRKAFESGAPPYNAPRETIETMHRATAELKESGIEGRFEDWRPGSKFYLVQSGSRAGGFG